MNVQTFPSFRCSVNMTIYVCVFVSHLRDDWQHRRSSWISCIKRHEDPTYIPFSCNVRWDRMRLNAPNFYSGYLQLLLQNTTTTLWFSSGIWCFEYQYQFLSWYRYCFSINKDLYYAQSRPIYQRWSRVNPLSTREPIPTGQSVRDVNGQRDNILENFQISLIVKTDEDP